MSSIKVHLVAITISQLFAHLTRMRSLKGLVNLFLQIRDPTLLWGLNLVLNCLMKQPFEPLVICFLLHLSMKAAFLVAITSAWRVGKIGALMAGPPFTVFSREKVSLQPIQNFYLRFLLSFTLTRLFTFRFSFLSFIRQYPKPPSIHQMLKGHWPFTWTKLNQEPFRKSHRLLLLLQTGLGDPPSPCSDSLDVLLPVTVWLIFSLP